MVDRDKEKQRIRKACSFFWKRFYIFVPLLFVVFFVLGYSHEHNHLVTMSSSDIEMLYGTLTDELIQDFSRESGFTWAIFYSALSLIIVFILTVLSAHKNMNLPESEAAIVRALRITRRVLIAPFIISLIICIVGAFTGVEISMMGSTWVEHGLDAFTSEMMLLVLVLWWLYLPCFVGIIVTSIKIIKKNKK